MKQPEILDLAYDMGFVRPRIVKAGEWDNGNGTYVLTYGPLSDRKTLTIKVREPRNDQDRAAYKAEVRATLETVMAPQPVSAGDDTWPPRLNIPAAPAPNHDRLTLGGVIVPVAREAETAKADRIATMNRIHERVTKAMDLPAGPAKPAQKRKKANARPS